MMDSSASLKLWLPLTLVLVSHSASVVMTVIQTQGLKNVRTSERSIFDVRQPELVSAVDAVAFATAFGFEAQKADSPAAGTTQILMSEMSPKLMAIAVVGADTVALVSVNKAGKTELLHMAIGDQQFGFELIRIDKSEVELKSAEKNIVLFLFKYMESPALGGV